MSITIKLWISLYVTVAASKSLTSRDREISGKCKVYGTPVGEDVGRVKWSILWYYPWRMSCHLYGQLIWNWRFQVIQLW